MVSMKPPSQPQAITKVSISALVIALPVLYASLLRLPPSTLAGDTAFWFLMSNSIIAIIAADSGMLFFRPAASNGGDDRPSGVPAGDDQPAVDAVQEDFRDAMSSVLPSLMTSDELPAGVLMTSDELPAGVDTIPDVMGGEQLPTDMEDHAPPDCIKGEDDTANKQSTEMDHPLLHRCEEQATVLALEPSNNKNYSMIVKGEQEEQEDEEVARDPEKSEPWRRPAAGPVTNESLDEAAAEEEDEQWPISHPRATSEPDRDVQEDRSAVMIKRKETVMEPDEPEYWQLSDEELNRKVEEFITRFNRDMVEQEAGV